MPSWRAWLGAATCGALGVQFAARLGLGDFGVDGPTAIWTYTGILVATASVVLLRARMVEEDRLAWGFIGAGLAAWACGDLYYILFVTGTSELPYPSLADAFYLAEYVCLVIGVRLLGGRLRSKPLASLGLVVSILGLATLWSWGVFSDVVEGATGDRWAVATTLAYPLLDLILLSSVLVAIAARGRRTDPVFSFLAIGFLVSGAADSIYAVETAHGTYLNGSVLDAMWPTATALIMAAAVAHKPRPVAPLKGDRLVLGLALGAVSIAAYTLVWDHFERLDNLTVALACATMVAAAAQVIQLVRENARAERRASSAEAVRSASLEAAIDSVVSIDGEGVVREWNAAAGLTFGYERAKAVGQPLARLILPPGQPADALTLFCAPGAHQILNRREEVTACHAGGAVFPVELAAIRIQDDPPIYTAFIRDLSQRKRHEEENHRLAAMVRSSEDAVLSKDLDGVITAWNHGAQLTYGYAPAEAIGQNVASLLAPDDRIDEFEKLMRAVRRGETTAFETRRRHRDGHLVDVSLRSFPIRNLSGETIGVTTLAHDITDRCRREEEQMNDEEGNLWRSRLRSGMSDGSLTLWAQPIVTASGGVVDHEELLMRLTIGGETIAPGRFLAHAETGDLILELDRWSIRKGLKLARSAPVAINLSAKSVAHEGLATFIENELDSAEHAGNVVFEITETAAIENLAAARTLVERLSAIGCRVALDDFGTGYGSFNYLQHLPVTEIKIDIEFIRNVVENEIDQRIVRSIIAVAQIFGMRTVAEGVEDEKTLELLTGFGVDLAQGYLLGHPAPIGDRTPVPA